MYTACTLKNSNMTCVMRSRWVMVFRGASVSKTGCPSTTLPSICIQPWAGGTVAIVGSASDPKGHPPGFAPRSTRTKNGVNTHLSKNTFSQHGHGFLSAQSLPNCSRSESAGQPHFRTSGEEFDYLADPTHTTGYETKEFDKIASADGDTTPINDPNNDNISDFSKIRRENTSLFGVPTMLEASVSHVSHGEFQHASGNRCLTERGKRKFCDQCCRVDVLDKSTEQYQESFSSDSWRILFWWTRSPRRPGTKSSTSRSWWKFGSEKLILHWVRPGDPELRAKKFRKCIDWVAKRAWIAKTTITGQINLSVRGYTCGVS